MPQPLGGLQTSPGRPWRTGLDLPGRHAGAGGPRNPRIHSKHVRERDDTPKKPLPAPLDSTGDFWTWEKSIAGIGGCWLGMVLRVDFPSSSPIVPLDTTQFPMVWQPFSEETLTLLVHGFCRNKSVVSVSFLISFFVWGRGGGGEGGSFLQPP